MFWHSVNFGKDAASMNQKNLHDVVLRRAGEHDVDTVIGLARRIWSAHYTPIIGPAQIEYMLSRMYAPATILAEIARLGVCYELAEAGGDAVGFSSYGPGPAPGEMKLHKLYVLPENQGAGLGRKLLLNATGWGASNAFQTIVLAVNKRNHQAFAAYCRYGFSIREEVVVDIGGGFVMDDYIMTSPISSLLRTSSMV